MSGEARLALEAFINQAIGHPAVEAILLYGSSLWKSDPADFDFVMLLDKPGEYLHFYAVHPAYSRRAEVEYLTPDGLDEFLTHPHWHVHNWEIDLGAKFVHGQIVLDRQNRLAEFRAKLTGPAVLPVRRYLFVHNYGQALSRLDKLAKANSTDPAATGLVEDFVHAFNRSAYHARLAYPWQPYLLDGWPLTDELIAGLTGAGEIKVKQDLLGQVVSAAISNLALVELLAGCAGGAEVLAKIPLYHLVDYTGLSEIVRRVRPDLTLPPEIYFSLFNA